MAQLEIATATPSDVDSIYALEACSFPSDEAASRESIVFRQENANRYFYVLKSTPTAAGDVIGFVNGTLVEGDTIAHESMSSHSTQGRSLVIHSLTISPYHRGHGYGSLLLRSYISLLRKDRPEVDRIMLLSKAYLLHFYTSCGFVVSRLSPVVHGKDDWFELTLDLVELRRPDQVVCDAFANDPYTGNPAAIVFEQGDDCWMQKVASENNLSETAFLSKINRHDCKEEGGRSTFTIRWFTPTSEVDLCGHATLAAAHALYETKRVNRTEKITFLTLHSGSLFAVSSATAPFFITLDFPSMPPKALEPDADAAVRGNIISAFHISSEDILYLGRSLYDLLVELRVEAFQSIRKGEIDMNRLMAIGGRGIIVTCLGAAHYMSGGSFISKEGLAIDARLLDKGYDFVSRFFGPCVGIPEDPVTGSAHCSLAPYWLNKLGGIRLIGFQASERGGVVVVSLDESKTRVSLSGSVVTTIKGKIVHK